MNGLDCSKCEAYQATQANDVAWKLRVSDRWKAEYNVEAGITGTTCVGCTSPSGRYGFHCYNCDIRRCGQERGVANCAACPDYACEKLQNFFGMASDAPTNLDLLRS